MRPIDDLLVAEESHQDLLTAQRELGVAIKLSIDTVTFETLPQEIGLLLIRLAMAEVLRDTIERDPD
jgi:hypothetical protein